jgi:ankyrin repeat protein
MIFSTNISILHILARNGDAKALQEMCMAVFEAFQDPLRRVQEINIADNNSWTPMHHAAHSGEILCIDVLLQYGGLLDIENSKGKRPRDLAKDTDTAAFLETQERRLAEKLAAVKAKLWVMKHMKSLYIKVLPVGVMREVLKFLRL